MEFIFYTLVVSYVFLFLYSLKIKDNSIVDVFWGFGFMIIAVLSFFQSERAIPQILVTGLVLLWGIRLTSHIGLRKLGEGKEDPRYAKWREEWGSGWYFIVRSFLQVYMFQMILMIVVATPILVVNTGFGVSEHGLLPLPSQGQARTSQGQEQIILIVGVLIALFGLLFETISDKQLAKFIKTKKPGEIFTTGLYRYSRHPNYFGESMFWLGISFTSLLFSYIGIIGWFSITFLLLFVSGVPLQEARYAGRANWEDYKAKTSVFVPWFPKK